MARVRNDTAAYAANWRQVLAVDAGLGVVAVVVGVVVIAVASPIAGAVIVAIGLLYLAMVVLRARRWARLRSEAGL